MQNQEITFLFGAGADQDACPSLPQGKDFAHVLLTSKSSSERKQLLGDGISQYQLIYPQSKKVFLQSIVENKEEAEKVFGAEVVQNCCNYSKDNKKGMEEKQIKELTENVTEYCKTWYELITNKCDSSKEMNFFLEHAVFCETLDKRFNALRYSDLKSCAKSVINAYTMIFIEMMKKRYSLDKDFSWDWENVFNQLCNSDVKKEKQSYYNLLAEQKENLGAVHIATTNYTDVAEKIIGARPIYLHGNLSWFEDYERLIVYDCNNEDEKEEALRRGREGKIFPFIMVSSGVKPLICRKQIEEYSKFVDALKHSDKLCVIGYQFNIEDNHINSMIGEWVHEGKHKLYYFYYNESEEKSAEKVFEKLPHCIQRDKKYEDVKETVRLISICKENAQSKFKKFLEFMRKESV